MDCPEKEETVRIGSLPGAADCCAKSRLVSFFLLRAQRYALPLLAVFRRYEKKNCTSEKSPMRSLWKWNESALTQKCSISPQERLCISGQYLVWSVGNGEYLT